jgi:PIN domain nuclease of toxin-antitoxin system
MSFLLDTCAFLWVTIKPDKLSYVFLDCFGNPANTIFLSSVTAWEIGIKYNIGKLKLPTAPSLYIPEQREGHHITELELSNAYTFHLETLPLIHKDPFDRMLVCQAIQRSLTILTPDPLIRQYPIRTLW